MLGINVLAAAAEELQRCCAHTAHPAASVHAAVVADETMFEGGTDVSKREGASHSAHAETRGEHVENTSGGAFGGSHSASPAPSMSAAAYAHSARGMLSMSTVVASGRPLGLR